jgi:hypothetical protein
MKLAQFIKAFKLLISLCLFASITSLSYEIIRLSAVNQQNKLDNAEVNHIRYGLFSVDVWKEKLAGILSEEIQRLNLLDANKDVVKKHLEIQLAGLIDNVDKKIRDSNEGTTKGWIKQTVINAFVDIKDIKAGIPTYADTIMDELDKNQTESKLKALVKTRLDKYLNKTFATQDLSRLTGILKKTGTTTLEAAQIKLGHDTGYLQNLIYEYTWVMVCLSGFLFVLAGFGPRPIPAPTYILLLMSLLALLAAGVSTAMIDMDARISEMSFMLLGHKILFQNQVVYFQSKSILDVFWIMMTTRDLLMNAVGILMVSFSLLFPLTKMFASLFYYYDVFKARTNRVIQFFVLKSGKWSMTDVQVVAIFMAYVGFNGIITSQFGNLNTKDQDLVILTTSGTSLQPGFYIFLTYAMLAMFLSGFLAKDPKSKMAA